MKRIILNLVPILWFLLALAFSSCTTKPQISQAELTRRTQEMFDAVAPGDKAPWQKYFADDCMYFDEKGRSMDKSALVASITPLPKGFSGNIHVVNVNSHVEGNVAIMSYDMDEKESIFGQDLSARYHATDTWMLRHGQWQIVAGQVLRYYEDPGPGTVDPRKFKEYAGTYELAPGTTSKVVAEGSQLFRQRGHRAKELLIPEAGDIFFRKGVEGRILFGRSPNGVVDRLIDRRNNEDVIWKKIN